MIDYPALRPEDVNGSHLFADRLSALHCIPKNGVVAEIGVAFGGFTQNIIQVCEPKRFDAFDIFTIHKHIQVWGKDPLEVTGGLTHLEFYENRLKNEIASGRVRIISGDSADQLNNINDNTYDVMYIDALHSYEAVKRDADVAVKKLRSNGVLISNDYVLYDHHLRQEYGVVPVVNDLCVYHGCPVYYFAFQKEMSCDIALIKKN